MKKNIFLFLIIFISLLQPIAQGQTSGLRSLVGQLCIKEMESVPVQAGGRVKPLYVHAKEMVKYLTGESSVEGRNSLEAFCELSLKSLGVPTDLSFKAKIEHEKLREYLNLPADNPRIEISSLVDQFTDLRGEAMAQKEGSSYKKALNKLLGKINTYNMIGQGQSWKFPMAVGTQIQWIPLGNFFQEKEIKSLAQKYDNPFSAKVFEAKEQYDRLNGDDYTLELLYSKWHLFGWALGLTLLALGVFHLNKKVLWSLITVSLVLQVTAMTMRILISGRAPITNMYETVMFSGFGALILALIIYFYKKDDIYVQAGLVYNFLCLMMMQFANNMLSPSISPLVPVLRDNFWLSTHVTCIIFSYGALALSWVLANLVLIKQMRNKLDNKELKHFTEVIHSSLKYGTVCLAAGIILGGVWADYSWGRFWGWDPKETWSLIVLLVYMAILHGRHTNWINPKRFIPLTAGAFMSVMMAWFGVNYILASGLHSYGFSEGGAVFLMSFFAVQIAILVAYAIKYPEVLKNKRQLNRPANSGA